MPIGPFKLTYELLTYSMVNNKEYFVFVFHLYQFKLQHKWNYPPINEQDILLHSICISLHWRWVVALVTGGLGLEGTILFILVSVAWWLHCVSLQVALDKSVC